jgi:hypothetical protein
MESFDNRFTSQVDFEFKSTSILFKLDLDLFPPLASAPLFLRNGELLGRKCKKTKTKQVTRN